MKKKYIEELFNKFEKACHLLDGIECWSARDLQHILGYTEWRNFKKVIDKSKNSCVHAGELSRNHFVEFNKMVKIGSGALKSIGNFLDKSLKPLPHD